MLLLSLQACVMVVDFTDGEVPVPTDPPTTTTTETPPTTPTTPTTTTPTTPTETLGTPPEGPPMVVGEAAGDAVGARGVWIVADKDSDGVGALVVSGPDGLARFTAPIAAPVWWSSAALVIEGETIGSGFADLGDRIAVGQPATHTVWLLPDDASGTVDPAKVATGTITTAETETSLGDALAAGDYDGDGVLDLAIGDPAAHDGDGDLYLGTDVESAVLWDAAEREIRLRGEGGLGVGVGLGPFGGGGNHDLLGCDTVADGRCFWVTGVPDDNDIVEVAVGTFLGAGGDTIDGPPRILDVDGDGAEDLLLGGQTTVGVWYGPVPVAAHDWTTADWRVTGTGIGACTGAGGSLVCGAGDDLVEAPSGTVSIALGTVLAAGATGDALGAALSDRVPFDLTFDLAVAAPGMDLTAPDAGAVLLEGWP